MSVIEVLDLVKDYGAVRAVDGASFAVEAGEVFALLGPNGAGKSTTVEILEGFRSATAGSVRVLGLDPAEAGRELRDRCGIVLQTSGIDPELSVREAIALYGAAYRRRRGVDEVIDLVGLGDKADARVKVLSGGQQRRLDLALGLVGDPEVLFLDEPTTGFDPSARRQAWATLEGLRELGTTVLLTTHYLDEAEHLADRVAVIDGGRIVALGTAEELRSRSGSDTVLTCRVPSGFSPDALTLAGRVEVIGSELRLTTPSPTADLHELTGWAVGAGVELDDLSLTRASLEDVYLALVDGNVSS